MSERIKAQTYVKRDWQWGDVAMVTGRGVTRPAVKGALHGWYGPGGYLSDDDVTDARPLAVIDPEDRGQVERLNSLYYSQRANEPHIHALAAALREFANPTPPRIAEPGQFGVVEASCTHSHGRRHWVKGGNGNWYPVDNDAAAPNDWDSLIDPVLVREGVTA